MDVAFDRTLGFYLSNFSSHEIYWPTPAVKWWVHIEGLENVTRTCPVITYETTPARETELGYFLRACMEVPKLVMNVKSKGFLMTGVSIFVTTCTFFALCTIPGIPYNKTLGYRLKFLSVFEVGYHLARPRI